MAFQFSQGKSYEPGDIFLGLDPKTNAEIGFSTERNLITIAGAGSGKGACLLIPNLRRWHSSAVIIDPKGENVERSWEHREAMGQTVGVLDPFHQAAIPDRLRVSINPLELINPTSRRAGADITATADGMVVRNNPEHAEWDNGAVAIIAGVIAYVVGTAPPKHRTLQAVRRVLLQSDDDLNADAQRMLAFGGFGGLAKGAGDTILTALKSSKGMEKDCLGGAKRHTRWLDDDVYTDMLGSSTFDLASLTTGKGSLYLVIPPDLLETQNQFLRLFVRTALNVMARGGNQKNERCLFLLDEFFCIGKLDMLAGAGVALMRSYGVQLWPFLQDIGQLLRLYGPHGATGFFSNSDAHIFFGNTDLETLKTVSSMLGDMTMDEIGPAPVHVRSAPSTGQGVATFLGAGSTNRNMQSSAQVVGSLFAGMSNGLNAIADTVAQHEANQWQAKAAQVGRARLPPEMIRELIAKKNEDVVARSMIVVGKGRDVFNLRLCPYFLAAPVPVPPPEPLFSGKSLRQLAEPIFRVGDLLGKTLLLAIAFELPWLFFGNLSDTFTTDIMKPGPFQPPYGMLFAFAAMLCNATLFYYVVLPMIKKWVKNKRV